MAEPTISLIIPTIARPSLARTLLSLRDQEWITGDEVLLVGDGSRPQARALWEQFELPGQYLEVPQSDPPDWGHTPRNLIMPEAQGEYLMALDDDDELVYGAIATVRKAIAETPDRPHLFRMRGAPCKGTKWQTRELEYENVGTPMFVTPAGKVGRYEPYHGGDLEFIRSTIALYPPDSLVWREEVIAVIRPGEV